MEQAPLIDVTGLTKQYAGVLAVDRLDFQVARGTVLGLVGPNGAGKTTSMRCMTGIIPATAGRIRRPMALPGLASIASSIRPTRSASSPM